VRRLTAGQEGRERVLRFVLETDADGPVAVEMRGDELRGILCDGDHVSIPASEVAGGTLWPRALANLSTGATVEMWQAPLRLRLVRFVGVAVATAAVSATVSAFVGLGLHEMWSSSGSQDVRPPGPGRVRSHESFDYAPLIVAVVIAAILILVYLWLGRRQGRSVRSAVLAGLAVGVIVGLVFALS
jgi:hypothetical protein